MSQFLAILFFHRQAERFRYTYLTIFSNKQSTYFCTHLIRYGEDNITVTNKY